MKLNDSAKCAVTSRTSDETGKILRLERQNKKLITENQQLKIEDLLNKRQLYTETELKYMFALFILEDGLTNRFNSGTRKAGRSIPIPGKTNVSDTLRKTYFLTASVNLL